MTGHMLDLHKAPRCQSVNSDLVALLSLHHLSYTLNPLNLITLNLSTDRSVLFYKSLGESSGLL